MTIENQKISLWIIPSILLAGCATTVDFPMTHFQSAETQGRGKFRLEGGIQAQNSIVLGDDFTFTAPTSDRPRIETDMDIVAGGNYGLIDSLDVGLRLPGHLFAKYQLIGSPRATALDDSFALSFVTSIGRSESEKSGSALFSSTDYEVELEKFYLDFHLVGGYRLRKELAIYGGPYYTRSVYDGEYRSIAGASTARSELNGSGKTWGGVLGLDLTFNNVGIQLETAFGRTTSGSEEDTNWGVGLLGSIGF